MFVLSLSSGVFFKNKLITPQGANFSLVEKTPSSEGARDAGIQPESGKSYILDKNSSQLFLYIHSQGHQSVNLELLPMLNL